MEGLVDEDRVSVAIDDAEILVPDADGEEFDSSTVNKFRLISSIGMARVDEGSVEHGLVKRIFLEGMGSFESETEIVAVHKNLSSSLIRKAKWESFQIFSQAMAAKCGGHPNIRYAWYGGMIEELCQIVSHGFCRCKQASSFPSYGGGLHLFPAKFTIDSALDSGIDESGLMHVLLCRVILGNMEVVPPGSKQTLPRSSEFDCGVDDLNSPTRYIVWAPFFNSYVLPVYIISFKALYLEGYRKTQTAGIRPSLPWIRFPPLISRLTKMIHPSKLNLVERCYDDFLKTKITRLQLTHKLRLIVGDKLLISAIKQQKMEG